MDNAPSKIVLDTELCLPPGKVNLMTGEWTDEFHQENVVPRLTGVEFYQEKMIPLPSLHNQNFWDSLKSSKIFFAKLDHRHWYYDDDIFEEYIRKIAVISFPVVCMFDSPYGYERPLNISMREFEQKLFTRTKLFYQVFHGKQPRTTILSPAVSLVDGEVRNNYRDYFLHNRMYFDAYNLHFLNDMSEHTFGRLSSLFNEVLSILHKPVWVTRWSIPSCNHTINSKNSLEESNLRLLSPRASVNRMLKYYESINDIAQDEIFWFYGGLNKDVYNSHYSVRSMQNKFLSEFCNIHEQMEDWNESCFMGIGDHRENIKDHILSMLEDLIIHE